MASYTVSISAVVLVLCVLQCAAHSVSYPSAWTRPGECLAIPLRLHAGYNVESVSVNARPNAARLWHTVYSGVGDDAQLDSACLQALQRAHSARATASLMQRQYVLIKNEGTLPAAANIAVSLQRVGTVLLTTSSASQLDDTAQHLQSAQDEQQSEGSTTATHGSVSQNAARGMHVYNRKLLSSEIFSKIEGRLSSSLSAKEKKWIKIGIIIAIVIGCLIALSFIFCIIRCLCIPCCCARRLMK